MIRVIKQMQDRTYKITLEVTADELRTLIQHAELEKNKVFFSRNKEIFDRWHKLRDDLAYHLDMITDYPWKL